MKAIKYILITIFISSSLYAETNNKIDNGYSSEDVETGHHFYQDPKKKIEKEEELKPVVKDEKKSNVKVLLEKIVDELVSVKRELEQTKKYINPNAPHIMVDSNGKECLSNSSEDCTDIPVIQEARNVPAMYNWIKEPTIENAVNYLKVQAKFFNHWTKMGYSLRFASLNGGAEVYPVDSQDALTPNYSFNKDKYKEAILNELKKRKSVMGTLIFLGINNDVENNWGLHKLSRIAYGEGENLNIALVFLNEEVKKKYDAYYSQVHDKELKEIYFKFPKYIDQDAFTSYNVKITPAAVAVYKDTQNNQNINMIIDKGFVKRSSIIYGHHNFLVYNNIVKPEVFNAENTWNVNLNGENK